MSRPRLSVLAVLLAALLSLLVASPGLAAPPSDDDVLVASTSDTTTPRPAPVRYHMGQFKYSVQTLNNCGPASVVSVLSYYGIDVSQEQARRVLRPYSESRGMSQLVIPPYVAQWDLQAHVRVNGKTEVIKTLVANNIPVIVLQWISETWRLGHFRVVQGYDDELGVFYVNDSLLGSNLAIPYKSFEARWDYNWSRFIPIFRPEQRPTMEAILGDDLTNAGMFRRLLPELQAKVKAKPTDWTSWGRLVEALTETGQYQAALDTLEYYTERRGTASTNVSSASNGAPSSSAPGNSTTRLKLLNKLSRYEEALAGVETALARSNGNAWGYGSLWLQKAEALRGLGRIDEARAAYEQAVKADGTMSEAGLGLRTLAR